MNCPLHTKGKVVAVHNLASWCRALCLGSTSAQAACQERARPQQGSIFLCFVWNCLTSLILGTVFIQGLHPPRGYFLCLLQYHVGTRVCAHETSDTRWLHAQQEILMLPPLELAHCRLAWSKLQCVSFIRLKGEIKLRNEV